MSDEAKHQVWDLQVIELNHKRVAFEEPVTLEEAHDLFLNSDHEDILDENHLTTLSISNMTPV